MQKFYDNHETALLFDLKLFKYNENVYSTHALVQDSQIGLQNIHSSRDTSPVMRLKLNPQTAQPHPYLEAFHCESAKLRCHSDCHS